MEIILKYNLPDEREDYESAYKGLTFKCAIQEYDNYLRSVCKYGEPSEVDAQTCRDKLWEILRDHDIEI